MNIPKYQSHKKVGALKIKEIAFDFDGSAMITPYEEGYDSFRVSLSYVSKHTPQIEGYYVVYEDGYESWSPARAFEDGYTRIL
jgi:hypothetical protein